ncbi:RimJ/RimL family protein N-acetyltransferase [Leifsonia sp. EB41]|uniref:GNAT family N-acetyltransferase n=1 Tax=Leifsonia sp. EB41 TaxID=3156260 RepID=UPI00351699C5
MPTPTERADEYWSAVFRVEPAVLRRPGVHTTFVDDPSAGIYVLRIGDTVRVRAREALRGQVDGLLGELSVEDALEPERWRSALQSLDPLILGPAAHFVAGDVRRPAVEEARPNAKEVQRMAARIPAEEVEESGVLERDVEHFGSWADGDLVAVSALAPWVGGRTDVGLLVAPAFRGRGLGEQVAAVALTVATQRAGLARWRCREDNAASMRLAARLGLHPYGRNLGIRV